MAGEKHPYLHPPQSLRVALETALLRIILSDKRGIVKKQLPHPLRSPLHDGYDLAQADDKQQKYNQLQCPDL